jgi:hypothetical protein
MIESRTAIFRPVNKDMPRVHHDALEFADGTSRRSAGIREGLAALERDGAMGPGRLSLRCANFAKHSYQNPSQCIGTRRL